MLDYYFCLLQEQFISFVNENGQTCAKETATVTDNEARFDVNGQMAYVFDYQQVRIFVNYMVMATAKPRSACASAQGLCCPLTEPWIL